MYCFLPSSPCIVFFVIFLYCFCNSNSFRVSRKSSCIICTVRKSLHSIAGSGCPENFTYAENMGSPHCYAVLRFSMPRYHVQHFCEMHGSRQRSGDATGAVIQSEAEHRAAIAHMLKYRSEFRKLSSILPLTNQQQTGS